MKIMEAIKPVFINGKVIEIGDKFSCPDDFANKLIESNSAKQVFQEDAPSQEMTDEKKKMLTLTKEELLKLAEEKGIKEFSERNKKEDIADAILLKAAEQDV